MRQYLLIIIVHSSGVVCGVDSRTRMQNYVRYCSLPEGTSRQIISGAVCGNKRRANWVPPSLTPTPPHGRKGRFTLEEVVACENRATAVRAYSDTCGGKRREVDTSDQIKQCC